MVTAAQYKQTILLRISAGANFREFRYQGKRLGLMPNCDHLGMAERPGLGDVEYMDTYRLFLPVFEVQQKSIPAEALTAGAEWEMRNMRNRPLTWEKMTVLEVPKGMMLWYEILLTPALLT